MKNLHFEGLDLYKDDKLQLSATKKIPVSPKKLAGIFI